MLDWDTSPYKSYKLTGGTVNPNYNTTFRILWPKNYDSTKVSTVKYPLVIMLHGAGESGLGNDRFGKYPNGDPRRFNNDHQLLFHGKEYLTAVNNGVWPGFVVFPQNIYGNWTSAEWILDEVVEIVETLSKTLKVDRNRIFVTGLSAGGQGVWAGLERHPHIFAGGLSYSGIQVPLNEDLYKMLPIPLWYFQGEIDNNPPKSQGDQAIKILKNAGGTPRYTVYPQTGHNTWTKAIREKDFFPFMLGHSKLSIHPYYGKTEFETGEAVNVKLAVSPGFNAYEWRKDGVIIEGATSNEIIANSLGSYTVRFRRGDVWTDWSQPLTLKSKSAPIIASQPSNVAVKAGESASFSVTVSGEGNYTYQWQKNNEDISGANESTFKIATAQPSDAGSYKVIISNSHHTVNSNSATLTVNSDLYAIIDSPAQDAKYKGGETINYSGSGKDTNGNDLPPDAFTWELIFNHPNSISTVWTRTNSTSGSFTVPTTGETSPQEFYRLKLTVTDETGTKKTEQRDIYPHLTTLTLNTEPEGLIINVDGEPAASTFEAVEGKVRTLEAVTPQELNGITYNFSSWSQGGDASQAVTVPQNDVTYTAVFVTENLEPVVYMDSPLEETMYRGGQTISYEGSGNDSEGKNLGANAFSWKLEFHLPDEITTIWTKTNSKKGTFTIPTTGKSSADEFYRLILTITDKAGKQKTVSRDLKPYTTSITLSTDPAGLRLNVDSATVVTPHTFIAVQGKTKKITAITPQTLSSNSYKFSKWSNNGSVSQTLTIPEQELNLTAVFVSEKNIEPVVSITSPVEGTKYSGGQTISYAGTGTDSKGKQLPASSFSWELEFNHPTAVTSMWTRTNSKSGTFTIPQNGHTSPEEFYKLRLTVTDPNGTKRTVVREIYPNTSTVTLTSEPEGLVLNLDTITIVTPYSFESVAGKTKTIEAITPQKIGGKNYKFSSWSQGGNTSQTISVPDTNTTYMAVFTLENIEPTAIIEFPGEGTMYRGGETFTFSGSGINSFGDSSSVNAYSWELQFHHPEGVSSIWTKADSTSGSFTIPTTGKTSGEEFYRLILTIEDPNGAKPADTLDLMPFTSKVSITTEPAGLKILLDSTTLDTPSSFEAVEGKERKLEAIMVQVSSDNNRYKFSKWKHGGDSSQIITIPQNDIVYTAIYELDTVGTDPLGDEEELEVKHNFSVYPNPTSRLLYINIDANRGENVSYEIVGSIGKSFKKGTIRALNQGRNTFQIDLLTLSSGSYSIKIEKDKKAFQKHFILIK